MKKIIFCLFLLFALILNGCSDKEDELYFNINIDYLNENQTIQHITYEKGDFICTDAEGTSWVCSDLYLEYVYKVYRRDLKSDYEAYIP